MERTLTCWEVEQLVDELSVRKRLWYGHDRLWVRRRDGNNFFALKLVNGLPDGLSAVYVRPMSDGATQDECERYVRWLIDRLTTYPFRMQVQQLLESQVASSDIARILALQISSLSERVGEEFISPPTPVSEAPRKISRYVRNLIK